MIIKAHMYAEMHSFVEYKWARKKIIGQLVMIDRLNTNEALHYKLR